MGNEQDDTTYYFVPDHDASGNIKYDANGAPVVVPDSAHALNGTAKSANRVLR
ncbi:MAG: hypothetical protein WDM87_16565 [Terracidiphilus sp.]